VSVRNCPECGRLFDFVFVNMCPECLEKEESCTKVVRDYLEENPASKISKVSEATGVSAKTIIRMLKSGMLEDVCREKNIKLLTCERCGEPISDGRFCRKCREYMTGVLCKLMESGNVPGNKEEESGESRNNAHFTEHFAR